MEHGRSSLDSGTPRMSVGAINPDTLSAELPFQEYLESLVLRAAQSGIGITQWSGEGQMPISQIPLENGVSLADYASQQFPELTKVVALNYYLHLVSACYVERESVMTRREYGTTPHKEKHVGTLNLDIASEWMSGELKPAIEKRLDDVENYHNFAIDEENNAIQFPFVKFEVERGGNRKIVSPRTKLALNNKKLNVVPLFMYKVLVNYIYEQAQDKVVRVHYKRTSGEERVVDITFNHDLIAEVYGETMATHALQDAYKGNFFEDNGETTITRGYVRVPVMGESKYDGIVRALNFSTIFKIEVEGIEPDLTFVNVNIPLTGGEFLTGVESLMETDFGGFTELCKAVREEGVTTETIAPTHEGVEFWLGRTTAIQGGTFLKRLSMFMLTNPQWFPKYTGGVDRPKQGIAPKSTDSIGLL